MTDFSNLDIDATINQFEAAASARHLDVPELRVRRALVVFDGSNQDRQVFDMGRAVAERLGCGIVLTHVPQHANGVGESERYVAEKLEAARTRVGVDVTSAPSSHTGPAFRQILSVAAAQGCDLIVFPSPYGENFEDLGRASVGSTTDMLLHHRTTAC